MSNTNQYVENNNTRTVPTIETEMKEFKNNTPVVILETPFGNVKYQESWNLNKGSLLQLLACYYQRVSDQKAEIGNTWQERVYPKLDTLFKTLRDSGFKMYNDLVANPTFEKDVITITLCGYENINFGLNVFVVPHGVKPNLRYNNANIRDILLHLVQRCRYITSCNLPTRYANDEKSTQTFIAVQQCVTKFLNDDINNMRNEWFVVRDEAGKHTGLQQKHAQPVEQKYHVRPLQNNMYHSQGNNTVRDADQYYRPQQNNMYHSQGDNTVRDANQYRYQYHHQPQNGNEYRKPVNRDLDRSGSYDQLQNHSSESYSENYRGGHRGGHRGGNRGNNRGNNRGGNRENNRGDHEGGGCGRGGENN